ncbi:TM0106 family RecB-like putative nuclease [Propionibacteriaceae bacterium G1746]|uniref:TM0106 family RecB-like putative nuclease n=1 Tax=Aestuariimicrobium sp. G57 TaxID=3418485 RepID=UPI003C198FAF
MILLDAYAARSCPVKTQNQYDPTVPEPGEGADAELQEIFAGSQEYKNDVLGRLATAPGALDLRDLPPDERRVATVDAVVAGTPVIVGPALPPDPDGHRRGTPDALVRGESRSDGQPGYHPVQVKRKLLVERRRPAEVFCWTTTLEQPVAPDPLSHDSATALHEHSFRAGREAELIQMAHYVRMLQDLGWAAPHEVAGLIGTDKLIGLEAETPAPESPAPETPAPESPAPETQPDVGIVWVDLRHRFLRTFSRTAETHWRLRSGLERYDHEFGFRVTVAETASRHVEGEPYTPRVTPIVVRECQSCPWWQRCEPMLDAEDVSRRITKTPLDVREISVLRKLGISTLADLAGADLAALMPLYLPEVAHRSQADKRLLTAAHRARMMRDGVALSRIDDEAIALPGGDIEIDLDIETSGDDEIYLWGLLVSADGHAPVYHPFVHWGPMTTDDQVALAREAMAFLERYFATGRRVRVYHYSDYESRHLRELADVDKSRDKLLRRAHDRVARDWVDLYSVVSHHFFGVQGLGLKVVAHEGAGFEWRDDEPGGLNSQSWFAEAINADLSPEDREAARRRVLAYNEDDVRATHALRAWLRAQHGAHA